MADLSLLGVGGIGGANNALTNMMYQMLMQKMQHQMTLETIMNQIGGYGLLDRYQSELQSANQAKATQGYFENEVLGALTKALGEGGSARALDIAQKLGGAYGTGGRFEPLAKVLSMLSEGAAKEAPFFPAAAEATKGDTSAITPDITKIASILYNPEQYGTMLRGFGQQWATPFDIEQGITARINALEKGGELKSKTWDFAKDKVDRLREISDNIDSADLKRGYDQVLLLFANLSKPTPEMKKLLEERGISATGGDWKTSLGRPFGNFVRELTQVIDILRSKIMPTVNNPQGGVFTKNEMAFMNSTENLAMLWDQYLKATSRGMTPAEFYYSMIYGKEPKEK